MAITSWPQKGGSRYIVSLQRSKSIVQVMTDTINRGGPSIQGFTVP